MIPVPIRNAARLDGCSVLGSAILAGIEVTRGCARSMMRSALTRKKMRLPTNFIRHAPGSRPAKFPGSRILEKQNHLTRKNHAL
jgi:hypothetical protein